MHNRLRTEGNFTYLNVFNFYLSLLLGRVHRRKEIKRQKEEAVRRRQIASENTAYRTTNRPANVRVAGRTGAAPAQGTGGRRGLFATCAIRTSRSTPSPTSRGWRGSWKSTSPKSRRSATSGPSC